MKVPVFAQPILRLNQGSQYEPVIEVVENENALLSQGNKGCLRNFHEDTGRQGQPEGQDLVLICLSFECKPQEWPVARKDQNMKARVLQVNRCKPILGTDAPKDALLCEHIER